MAQQTALQGNGQGRQPGDIDGETFAPRPATTSDGPPSQDELGRDPVELALPPGLLVEGQLGHLGKMLAQARVPPLQDRQQFVTDAVTGEGEVPIRRVFAPRLAQCLEVGFNIVAPGGKQRTQNAALRKLHDGMDGRESLGPGTTQELGQNGLGLIVQGVGSGHRIHFARGHQPAKPAVAQTAGRFLDALGGFACPGRGLGFGGCVHAMLVKGQSEAGSEIARKSQVGIGLGAAQSVMQMGGMKDQAEFPVPFNQGAQQRHGVGTAGESNGKAKSWLEEGRIDRKRSAHQRMIALPGRNCG